MKYIGIDPGNEGALVIIDDDGSLQFFDTPVLKVKAGKKTKTSMDPAEIVSILKRTVGDSEVSVVLEAVAAMPGQGVSSMFNFGKGFGIWQGILSAMQLPYTLVHPRTWKGKLMHDMGKEKDASIARAKQLYPKASDSLSRPKRGGHGEVFFDGRADALLMAHYARTFLQGASA